MQHQEIVKAKIDHANFTVADVPYKFSTAITLNAEQLERIKNNEEGFPIPLSEVIDDVVKVEDSIKKRMGFNYSMDDYDKMPFNFVLLDASITGIKSPDANGSMMLGGSLTLPAVHAATLPFDEVSSCGRHRKILPYKAPLHFIKGNPHVFTHTLTHTGASLEYSLLDRSAINPRMIFPGGDVEGTMGALPMDDDELVRHAKQRLVLHGHVINDRSVYPNEALRPTCTEVISADSRDGGAVKSQHLVALRNGSFPVAWYMSKEADKKFHRDEGVVAPIDDFVHKTYHFIDSCNESRATNFNECCVWWDVDQLKGVPQIKAKLNFEILPIVPYYDKESKVYVPYQNMVKHLRSQILKVDKPFSA